MRDLLQDMKRDSVRDVKRWKTADLKASVPNLMREIDRRREEFAGETPQGKFAVSHLAESVGLNRRSYYRLLNGEQVPNSEDGIERVLTMAQNVGMKREEAEAFLPEPLELVRMPPPEEGTPIGIQREILDEIRRNGVVLERIEKTMTERLDAVTALLTSVLTGR